jgi:hypothetical protein
MNQELETFLRIYMDYQQDNWVGLLPFAEYAYNSKQHLGHGHSSIKMAFGVDPKGFDGIPDEHWLRRPDPRWAVEGPAAALRRQAAGRLEGWADMWEIAKSSLEHAQKQNEKWYNKKRESRHFAEGDEVLLRAKNITTRRPSKKFDVRYLGLFTVSKRIGKIAYRLDLPPSMSRLHPVFNVSLLEPWYPPELESNFRPGTIQIPDDIAVGDRYEVEGILEHKDTQARGREYLVKWLGWPVEDSTWEPANHLDHCEEILREYLDSPAAGPRAPRGRPTGRRRAAAEETSHSQGLKVKKRGPRRLRKVYA